MQDLQRVIGLGERLESQLRRYKRVVGEKLSERMVYSLGWFCSSTRDLLHLITMRDGYLTARAGFSMMTTSPPRSFGGLNDCLVFSGSIVLVLNERFVIFICLKNNEKRSNKWRVLFFQDSLSIQFFPSALLHFALPMSGDEPLLQHSIPLEISRHWFLCFFFLTRK